MKSLTSAGRFWSVYFVMLICLGGYSVAQADPAASSGSTSGALSGAQSQAGSIGLIDSSVNTVEADDGSRAVRGVFAAGVTAGGSNPCVVSIGGGLSVPGGGINFANAYNDQECNIRETLRLMAAISSSAEAGNQVLLREISCQSVTMWDAFERTYNATSDERYFCENERPEESKRFIAGRIHHKARGSARSVADAGYDINGNNPVKHAVVSSMLSQGYEDDAWAMLMED